MWDKAGVKRVALLSLMAFLALASSASASTLTVSNSSPITVPGVGSGPGPADLFPSTIQVAGVVKATDATVTLLGVTHQDGSQFDVLLIGPGGQRVMLESDACQGGFPIAGATWTFATDATTTLLGGGPCTSGTYWPVDYESDDDEGLPFESGSRFLTSLVETTANGDWRLFVRDDDAGGTGVISGWTLGLELAACDDRDATITGTKSDDTLIGTPRADVFWGFDGNDVIRGRGGKDVICGGDDKDKLYGGGGNDTLLGEGGKDILRGGKGKDTVKGGAGFDREFE